MHGRVKVRTTAEQNEIKRKEREKKVKVYQAAFGSVVSKRSAKIYDQEALDITANMLLVNPDIITLWNYRREVFAHFWAVLSREELQKLLQKDLGLTEQCLRVNPKSYGSWHHRIWVLDHLPNPEWHKEIVLCNKYLEYDERNFHCWDYRKTVTERSHIPDKSEYDYTLEKIQTNFSNYSAWHLRSKLLPKIFPDLENKLPILESKHKEELELVQNAAFTDPNDQSAWFYQRWLLGLTEPKVHVVAVQACTNRVNVSFSRSLVMDKVNVIKVSVNNDLVLGAWESTVTHYPSPLWTFKFSKEIEENDTLSVVLCEEGEETDSVTLRCGSCVLLRPRFTPLFSGAMIEALSGVLSCCQELLELEPDSKWTLLTSVFLMQAIDSNGYHEAIKTALATLLEVDPSRRGYYSDMRSKLQTELGVWGMFNRAAGDQPDERKVEFEFPRVPEFHAVGKHLTCLYHVQYLMFVHRVDLSGNNLTAESLAALGCLLSCGSLHLDTNAIASLAYFPALPHLEVLSLKHNRISEAADVKKLSTLPKIKDVYLTHNPVADSTDINNFTQLFSTLTF